MKIINEKLENTSAIYKSLIESTGNETKSSAGDKHETAKAMAQLEQEKIAIQINELQNTKDNLEKIKTDLTTSKITLGSYIETDNGNFYVSVAIGKLEIDKQIIFVISPQSPIGSKMLGLNINESLFVNGKEYIIKNIV